MKGRKRFVSEPGRIGLEEKCGIPQSAGNVTGRFAVKMA